MSRAFAAGRTFSSRTLKAGWAARRYHTSVVDAAGAIYVIGGYDRTDGTNTYYQDVWASTDGGARAGLATGVVGGGDGGGSTQGGGCCVGTTGVFRGTQGVLLGYLGGT